MSPVSEMCVILRYQRPREEQSIDEKVFTVILKGAESVTR